MDGCKRRCRGYGRADNLERQLCGFWFCFWCLPRAIEKGASHWRRLYHALYPWR